MLKRHFIVALLGLSACTSSALANNSFDEVATFIPETYSAKPSVGKELIDWVPTGVPEQQVSHGCTPESLREAVLSGKNDPQFLIENFLSFCLPHWKTKTTGYEALVRFATVDYKFKFSRDISYYKIKLENGRIIRGLLALKPDSKPRPLIIVACGVMCDTGSRTSVYLLTQFFDETPFHVLMISNHTSHTFYEDNKVAGFGGVNAADTIIRLARAVQNPKTALSKKISEVHAFGVSLGSHETLYAALASSSHIKSFGESPIKSFGTMCTVIDYPKTVGALYDNGLVGKIFIKSSEDFMRQIATDLNVDYSNPPRKPNGRVDYNALNSQIFFANQLRFQQMYPQITPWSFPLFDKMDALLEFSKFQNFLTEITQPIFVLASKDDPIVDQRINTQNLLHIEKTFSQSPFTVAFADEGSHCATSMSYGWRNMSLVMQSFFLAHSHEFREQLVQRTLPVKVSKLVEVFGVEPFSYEWTAEKEKDFAKLKLKSSGVLVSSLSVPLSAFGGVVRKPITHVEAQALTRWLNVQATVVDEYGEPVMSSGRLPKNIEFIEL